MKNLLLTAKNNLSLVVPLITLWWVAFINSNDIYVLVAALGAAVGLILMRIFLSIKELHERVKYLESNKK